MKLPGFLQRLLNRREKALIRKDLREIWQTHYTRVVLLCAPVLLAICLPAVFMVLSNLLPNSSIETMRSMDPLLSQRQAYMNDRQTMFYVFSDCLGPLLFLMIPLIVSSATAACSFVGEKERGTVETLFLTCFTTREILKAKVLGCLALSSLVTLLSFLLFGIVMTVGDVLLGVTFFFVSNWTWPVLVLVLAPALTLFGVLFMVMVSGRSHSYMESMQICGYVLLPLALLFVGQFSGAFRLDAGAYLLLGLLFYFIDCILWQIAARRFTAEKLLGA